MKIRKCGDAIVPSGRLHQQGSRIILENCNLLSLWSVNLRRISVTSKRTRLSRDTRGLFCRKPAWLLSKNVISYQPDWLSRRVVLLAVQIRLWLCRRWYLDCSSLQHMATLISVLTPVCLSVCAQCLACSLRKHPRELADWCPTSSHAQLQRMQRWARSNWRHFIIRAVSEAYWYLLGNSISSRRQSCKLLALVDVYIYCDKESQLGRGKCCISSISALNLHLQ